MVAIQENINCKKNDGCTFATEELTKKNIKSFFDILHKANKLMKKKGYPYVSSFFLVGSSKRNMVYLKSKNSDEYDFDIQCFYNNSKKPVKEYTNDLRKKFMDSLQEIFNTQEYSGYKWIKEDSTSVITIKKSLKTKRLAAFDLALIDVVSGQIHINDKKNNRYIWNKLGNIQEAYQYANKLEIKDLKREYINLKCNQKNLSKDHKDYKPSSNLFIEAVNNLKKRR